MAPAKLEAALLPKRPGLNSYVTTDTSVWNLAMQKPTHLLQCQHLFVALKSSLTLQLSLCRSQCPAQEHSPAQEAPHTCSNAGMVL